MKTLENHLILFDAECPLCNISAKAFVKTGLFKDGGRASYQNAPAQVCSVIDRQRAANEIALVNLKNGEVTYGVKSLFKIIGNAFPLFNPIFSFKPFIWLMSKFYAFIAYNRRVIVPAATNDAHFIYQPSLKIKYRVAYLLFTWFCVGYILTAYAKLLAGMVPLGNPLREYMICGGQLIFQGIVILTFAKDKFWSYLGNMMTISFAGSLLLLFPLLLTHWLKLPTLFCTLYFMGVAGLMFLEHIRRTKLLELGWALTFTWVLYRAILLIWILKFD